MQNVEIESRLQELLAILEGLKDITKATLDAAEALGSASANAQRHPKHDALMSVIGRMRGELAGLDLRIRESRRNLPTH